VFNAGLLARSQYASGRSCDRPTRTRFSVVFLGLRVNAVFVPKFHVSLHASHAALPVLTSTFRPHGTLPHVKIKISLLLPCQGFMSELGVVTECRGTLLNFSPCSTFRLYLLHIRMPYFLSNPPLSEGRVGTAWGTS
jgi:hypothetical protein